MGNLACLGKIPKKVDLPELRITTGAYPQTAKESVEKYLAACEQENDRVQIALHFALLCVLESISFARKDGQYLRWDYRAGRRQGKGIFNKGSILSLEQAISAKLQEIIPDLSLVKGPGLSADAKKQAEISLYGGSSLKVLPKMPEASFDAMITPELMR